MRSAFVFFLVAAVFAQVAFAQTTGTITGTLVDLAGEVVANAPIQATNTATKTLYKATSSEQGGYTIAQLPAGAYELSIAAPGFNPFSQQDVAVAAGQTLRLDIRLVDFQLGTLGDGREFAISPQLAADRIAERWACRRGIGENRALRQMCRS